MLGAFRMLRVIPRTWTNAVIGLLVPKFTLGLMSVVTWRGQVLFVHQRYRPGWSLPGGSINRSETPSDGARRELAEEIGLVIEPRLVTALAENDKRVRNAMFVYTVDLPDDEVPVIDCGLEIAEARWAPIDSPPGELHPSARAVLDAYLRVGR